MTNELIYFATRKGLKKIEKARILFIEADGRRSLLRLDNNTVFHLALGLAKAEKMLNDSNFVFSHRKYLVNLAQVRDVEKPLKNLVLGNG